MNILITGKSGSGKQVLQQKLVEKGFSKPILWTTCPITSVKSDRVDAEGDFNCPSRRELIIISPEQMRQKLSHSDFIYSYKFKGHTYGISKYEDFDNSAIVVDNIGLATFVKHFAKLGIEYKIVETHIKPVVLQGQELSIEDSQAHELGFIRKRSVTECEEANKEFDEHYETISEDTLINLLINITL